MACGAEKSMLFVKLCDLEHDRVRRRLTRVEKALTYQSVRLADRSEIRLEDASVGIR